jgi:perosamine synthetase
MHMQPVFINGGNSAYPDVSGSYPISADLWQRGFYLPSGIGLTQAQLEEVAAKLLECKA